MSQPSVVRTPQGPQVGPYIFGKTLGTGSTGKVKLARNIHTGEYVAIKIVRKDFLDRKPSLRKKMRREISVLKVLDHPNVMSLIDVFEIDTHLFLVMEYVDGLELFEYLVRRGKLPPKEALVLFQQIICGVEYCHRRLICHRDLKPENLLLDRDLRVKIADFGMTSLNAPGSLLDTSCGSPHYCDPMVVSGEKYDGLKADIWSCGVILYAMVTGRLPFDDDNIQRLLLKVQAGHFKMPPDLPQDLQNLIHAMLTVDPNERITLSEIKKHPWFTTVPLNSCADDNFVAPLNPIMNPDSRILQSLVDLGWDDVPSVREKLAEPGTNIEKVFYDQISKHRTFNRGSRQVSPTHPIPVKSKTSDVPEDGTDLRSGAITGRDGQGHSGDTDLRGIENDLRAIKVSAGGGANEAAAQPQSSSQNASTNIQSPGQDPESNHVSGAEEKLPRSSLVRQSELIRGAESKGDDDNIETAIESGGASQKSWFDSVREILWHDKDADKFDGSGSALDSDSVKPDGEPKTAKK